jgi:MFS family permease
MLAPFKKHLPLLAHNRNYRWLWSASIFTAFEEMLSFTAVTLYVLNLTGSGAAVAGMWAVQTLPALLAGSVAGVVADRFNRKHIMLIAGSLAAIGYACYALTQTVPQLFAFIAVVSVALTFARNASLALLPDVIADTEIMDANALIAMNFNLALMVAPLLGGALIAASGAQIVFFLLAGCRVLAVLCQSRIAYQQRVHPYRQVGTAHSWTEDVRVGLRYARDHAVIRVLLLTLVGTNFGGGGLIVLEALLIKQILNAGDEGYGLMLSLAGVGAIIGSLLIKPTTTRWSALRVFSVAVFITGLTFFPYANILWFPATLFIGTAQATTWVLGMVLADTLVQQIVPAALRGRVVGLIMLVRNGMTLVAMAVFGPLVDALGTILLLNVSGVIYTLAGVYAVWALHASPVPTTPAESIAELGD